MPTQGTPSPGKTPAPILQAIRQWTEKTPKDGVLWLSAREVKLAPFPDECLELPGLTRLVLRGHGISELPAGVARLAERGVILDIAGNPLRRIPAGPLPALVLDTLRPEHFKIQISTLFVALRKVAPCHVLRKGICLGRGADNRPCGVRFVPLRGP